MMQKNSINKKRRFKDRLLRAFLVVSIIFSIFLVSNCDDLFNHIPVFPGGGGNVGPGNNSSGSEAITALFRGAAQGAGGQIGGTAAGWALGALGLSDDSPDFAAQLDKIDESLQEIISQLNAVQEQLAGINNQLQILNCSTQQTALTTQTGRIDYLTSLYRSYVATAANGGRITNTTLSNWVDQVLAEGQYTSQTPMGQILTTVANQLIQPSSGAITSCVQAIEKPGNDTFSDIEYYNKASQFTDYYYYYQAQGLFLLNEALHYRAWAAAASEDDDNYPADSVAEVCSNASARLYCTKAGTFTNNVYNALTDQFTAAGAPYTDDYFIIQNSETTPRLWVKSLEEFTIAHGDNCGFPLESDNNRCGVTVGRYNGGNSAITNEVYRGYSGWQFASSSELNTLLSGWNNGTASAYFSNKLGFKDMNKKIIISTSTTNISIPNSGGSQTVVIFLDTQLDKSLINSKLYDNQDAFNNLIKYTNRINGYCPSVNPRIPRAVYTYSGYSTNSNTSWYFASAEALVCPTSVSFSWNLEPGWLASNLNSVSKQFRLPFSFVQDFSCTNNRSKKNAGGVYTTCGEDFTYWFNNIVPRPETCDLNVGVTCKLDYQSLAKAKRMFETKYKPQI